MTTLLDSEIKYDRITKDYAIYIGGELIGYGSTYSEAEQIRTEALAELHIDMLVTEREMREAA
jgi:hypothetical protein